MPKLRQLITLTGGHLKIASHTTRVAAAGILAALALTASGCSGAPGAPSAAGSQQAVATAAATVVPPKTSLANAQVISEGFLESSTEVSAPFTEAEAAEIEKTGVAALQIMIEDHPEYTVAGFKPTLETWSAEIAPKLRPLSLPTAWQEMTNAWTKAPTGDVRLEGAAADEFLGNPVMTSKPDILDSSKAPVTELSNTWKSDAGETCSPSDKPFEYDVKSVALIATNGADMILFPMIAARMDVIVHCAEGGKLTTEVDHIVPMKRGDNGKFLVYGAGTLRTPGGSAVLEK